MPHHKEDISKEVLSKLEYTLTLYSYLSRSSYLMIESGRAKIFTHSLKLGILVILSVTSCSYSCCYNMLVGWCKNSYHRVLRVKGTNQFLIYVNEVNLFCRKNKYYKTRN